jgi:hypothetical protein
MVPPLPPLRFFSAAPTASPFAQCEKRADASGLTAGYFTGSGFALSPVIVPGRRNTSPFLVQK